MTHVVTGSCIDCRYTTCVEECPVDAFHGHERMVVINPNVCIDCDRCTDACPISAIVTENTDIDGIEDMIKYAELASDQWPTITKKQSPYPDPIHPGKWENRPILNTSEDNDE